MLDVLYIIIIKTRNAILLNVKKKRRLTPDDRKTGLTCNTVPARKLIFEGTRILNVFTLQYKVCIPHLPNERMGNHRLST